MKPNKWLILKELLQEGRYSLTEDLQILSYYDNVGNILDNPRTLKYRLNQGYIRYTLCKDSLCYDYALHQIVMFINNEYKPTPKGLVIDHIDRNKLNNKLDNLRYVTAKENSNNVDKEALFNKMSSIRKNRKCEWQKGSKNHMAILKEEQVKQIKILYLYKLFTYKELSIIYDCKERTIEAICLNETWKHITI